MESVFKIESGVTGVRNNDFLHWVRSGDSLFRIALQYYSPMGHDVLRTIVDQILQDNPQITNPDMIRPGQLLLLRSPFRVVRRDFSAADDIHVANNIWDGVDHDDQNWIARHHGLLHVLSLVASAGHGAAHGGENILHQSKEVIATIAKQYAQYKNGAVTKGAYDAFRKRALATYNAKVPQLYQQWKFSGLKSNEAFRISAAEARMAGREIKLFGEIVGARPLASQIAKLKGAVKLLKGGAFIGQVAVAGFAGFNVYEAWGSERQGEVICEESGGFAASTAVAITLTAILAATGVGLIGMVLIIGASTALAHAGGGAGGKALCEATGLIPSTSKMVPLTSAVVE